MPIEFLYATSHITGNFPNPANAVGNTPSTWAGSVNDNTSYTSRWAIGVPSAPLEGTQTVRVTARKGSNSGTPTIQVNLYEAGTLVQSGSTVNVTSTTGQTITVTFGASLLADPADLEVEVVQSSASGNPNTRNCAQISRIEWEAAVEEEEEEPPPDDGLSDLRQVGFLGRDDVTLAWKSSQNGGWNQPPGEAFRMRFKIQNGNFDTGDQAFQLQARRNSGAWSNVTPSSSVVRAVESVEPNVGLTEQIMFGGTGSFRASAISETGVVDPVDFIGSDQTEIEYVIELVGADVSPNDVIEFRAVKYGGEVLSTYNLLGNVLVSAPPPSKVTGLTLVSVNALQLVLEFDDQPNITFWSVYRNGGWLSGTTQSVGGNRRQWTGAPGAGPGTYNYTVSASNNAGEGQQSDPLEVVVPVPDDSVFISGAANPHGSTVAHDKLFISTRQNPARLVVVPVPSMQNVDVISFPTVATGGIANADTCVYSSYKDRVYVTAGSTAGCYVAEVNPSTHSWSRVIADANTARRTTAGTAGHASLALGKHLFVLTFETSNNAKLLKYDLDTYSFVAELVLTGRTRGHALTTENGMLYAVGSSSPGWFARINPDTLAWDSVTLEVGDNIPTDDVAVLNGLAYIGLEQTNNDQIVTVDVDTFDINRIFFDSLGGPNYGVETDGSQIWFVTAETTTGNYWHLDPDIDVVTHYTAPEGLAQLNEIMFHEDKIYFTTWGTRFFVHQAENPYAEQGDGPVTLSGRSSSPTRSAAALTATATSLSGFSQTETRTLASVVTLTALSAASRTDTRSAANLVSDTVLGGRSSTDSRVEGTIASVTTLAAQSRSDNVARASLNTEVSLSGRSSTTSRGLADLSVETTTLSGRSLTNIRLRGELTVGEMVLLSGSSQTSTRSAAQVHSQQVSLSGQSGTDTRTLANVTTTVAPLGGRSATSSRTFGSIRTDVTLSGRSSTGTRTWAELTVGEIARLSARSLTEVRTQATLAEVVTQLQGRSATDTRTRANFAGDIIPGVLLPFHMQQIDLAPTLTLDTDQAKLASETIAAKLASEFEVAHVAAETVVVFLEGSTELPSFDVVTEVADTALVYVVDRGDERGP